MLCIGVVLIIGLAYHVLNDSGGLIKNATFTVTTIPVRATIKFENYSQTYSPGMQLPPGAYQVSISAIGFQSKTVHISHFDQPSTTHITLERTRVRSPSTPITRRAKFTILPEPQHAQVILLESSIPYRTGMVMELGTYKVQVSALGYEPQRVLINHSGDSPYRIVLKKLIGPLTVLAQPSDAQIEILETDKVYQPGMLLPFGKYRVKITAPGYKGTILQLVHDETSSHTGVILARLPNLPQIELDIQSEPLLLNTDPADANVVLVDSGKQYQKGMELKLGIYRIEVNAPGFITRSVTIDHQGTAPHTIALNRELASLIVHTDPLDAKVELLTSGYRYEDNVSLPPGRYMVRVSAPSHQTKTLEIQHRNIRSVVNVSLDRSIHFDVGSDQELVIALHGTPSIVTRQSLTGNELWHYGDSTITINSQTRSVVTWNNAGNLRVRTSASSKVDQPTYIEVGSESQDVVHLHGPPSAIIRSGPRQPEAWHYGASVVTVDPQTRKVLAIRNAGNLITRP